MGRSAKNKILIGTPTQSYPRILQRKFIDIYRENECLWNHNNYYFKEKTAKEAALNKLVKLVKGHFPETTRMHVLRKIDGMRSTYRREKAKVQQSIESGGPVYEPRLWYYNHLMFLEDKTTPEEKKKLEKRAAKRSHKTSNTTEEEMELSDNYLEESLDNSQEYDDLQILDEIHDEIEVPYEDDEYDEDQNQKYNTVNDTYQEDDDPHAMFFNALKNVKQEACATVIEVDEDEILRHNKDLNRKRKKSKLNNSISSMNHRIELTDEFDAIGINVAAKLRSLPPNSRVIAEKLINDVLYQGQINGLSTSSQLVV